MKSFSKPFVSTYAACILWTLAAGGQPSMAEEAAAIGVGSQAPGWSMLEGVDGQHHSLSDLKDRQVVVVCFTSNTCPYSVDYEQRLIDLQSQYSDHPAGVQLVAINANAVSGDRLDEMKKRASDRGFRFLYLRDETQEVARAWGAIYTPEFFVLNKDRTIIYKGAMDDSTDAEKVKIAYVDLAVQAAIDGKKPEVTETGARGCAIRFKRRRR
ncbi:MAG: thioredoxin family protein [Planctomycetaceae bacterium]|nr:thioredoxin family protein [Planctomycetaceae bacterium]